METLAGTAGPVVERLLEEYRKRYYSPERKPLCFFPWHLPCAFIPARQQIPTGPCHFPTPYRRR